MKLLQLVAECVSVIDTIAKFVRTLLSRLQPGDQALFVPNNLIVTLQRVLGDETLGKQQFVSPITVLNGIAPFARTVQVHVSSHLHNTCMHTSVEGKALTGHPKATRKRQLRKSSLKQLLNGTLDGSCKPHPPLLHPNTNPHCRRPLHFSAELLTTNKLSELACLALYLCYEKKQGRSSFWLPFIQELDRQRGRGSSAAESPLLWEPEEVEYFTGSPMKVRT